MVYDRLTMKLNELVCPSCGLKCLVDASYTTCASCNTFFYASQSRSVDSPAPLNPMIGIGTGTIKIVPCAQPVPPNDPLLGQPIWMVPIDGLPPPWGPSITCGVTCVTDAGQYQVRQ